MSDSEAAITDIIHKIAGKNAVSVNDESIRRLCWCAQYLVIQISMLHSDGLESAGEMVLKNALEILEGRE